MLSGGSHALKCFIWTRRKPGEVEHCNSSGTKAPGEHGAAENIQLQENTAFTPAPDAPQHRTMPGKRQLKDRFDF